MSASKGPLAGIVVVEVANFISGPLATMMLAQLGAEVIKVEPPKGDPFRRFSRPETAMSAIFANANRGKKSVTLDLKSDAGRQDLLDLVGRADVFLANWRPDVAQRLRLDDVVLAGRNPRLIRADVSGFGSTGPLAGQPVFDSIIQARAGMSDSQSRGPIPMIATTYLADKIAATIASHAVLAALLGRERTGVGESIQIAMLDAAAYLNFPDAMTNRTFLDHESSEARNALAAAVRPIPASDGWMMVVPVSSEQIQRSCTAVGHPEWFAALRRFTDMTAMTTELFGRLESVTQTRERAHWLDVFADHDVPAAPCLTLDEHLADEQVIHNQLYTVAPTPGVGPTRLVRYPATFAGWGVVGTDDVAPLLGEHTEVVLPHRADR